MDASLSATDPMAERNQGFVDDMNSQEMNIGKKKRTLKIKDKLAREATARMLVANLLQQWKAIPKGLFAPC